MASVCSFDYSRVRFGEGHPKPIFPALPTYSPAEVEAALDDLYARQDLVATQLMVAFAEMLGLSAETFVQHFVGGGDLGTIRLLQYPAAAPGEVNAEGKGGASGGHMTTGISPHTDFEFFTLMHQQAPGLQLLVQANPGTAGGEWAWVDAPAPADAFLVVAGDVFERFTNGVVRALPHRVVRTPHARSSLVRFNALKPDTVVEPLPRFVGEGRPARYTRTTMKQHMDTTMSNLKQGKGAWADGSPGHSLTATYKY